MPYITKGNVSKIISHIDSKKLPIDFGVTRGNVYKKAITFFSVVEQNNLLLRKEFYRKPNAILDLDIYKKIEKKEDTYTYTYEGGTPAYHSTLDCPRLNSNFDSYEIPHEIKERGRAEVIRFRLFFAQNKELLERNSGAFYGKMTAAFAPCSELKPVDYQNSGPELIEINDLSELEATINKLLLEAEKEYWNSKPEKRLMMNQFMRLTFLAFPPYNQKAIQYNETGFSDTEIRGFLEHFSKTYKIPITKYLKDYYRVFFNPDLAFEGELLEVLAFKKCSHCYNVPAY
jgi:hypothetical protein